MKAILLFFVFAIFITKPCIAQRNSFTQTLKHPKLVKLWETDTILKDIESAIYSKKNDIIYTTSINGHWLKPNGKGFISKIDLDGKIIKNKWDNSHKWINNIEGPTGTAIHNNRLFVADFDMILEIDLRTSKIIKKHKVYGTERINDLTVSKDGTIYGSGTKTGKLISLKNGKISILKNDLEWPNGLLYENKNLIIGLGNKTISCYNLNTKKSTILTKNISNPDGIAAIGNGDYLISSWEGMIHYVTKKGVKTLLLDTSKEKINAADISYIPHLKIVLVPAMLQHKLIAYKLTDEN